MLQEVTVKTNRAENEIVAVTDAPVPADEILTLSLACNGEVSWDVRLVECRPMMWEGSVAYGLRVAVLGEEARCGISMMDEGDYGEFFGVLTREVSVRLLDISRSGCLLESPRDLCLGTTGEVWFYSGRGEHSDDILRELGCDGARIERLRNSGVL